MDQQTFRQAILLLSGENSVAILRGRGDGTFESAGYFGVGHSPRSLAVSDVDQDDLPDLVVANGDGTVSVLLGLGDGTFGTRRN